MMKKYIKSMSCLLCIAILLMGCKQENLSDNLKETINDKGASTLNLMFTIDTEDKFSEKPIYITGELDDNTNYGVNFIMDTFEKYNMKAVFFVDIYEQPKFDSIDKDFMNNLMKDIDDRGFEVALHAHPNKMLGFYDKGLDKSTYEEQLQVLDYGVDYIEAAIGKRPITFRGGAYRCNEDTFKALEDVGILFDSTYFYGNENNNIQYNSLNKVCTINNLIEFPVITTIKSNGSYSKLDINWMSDEEIIQILEQMKLHNLEYAQIMFHSFSFLRTKPDFEGEDPICYDGEQGIYGPNEDLIERFENLLKYINEDENINVVTFFDIKDELSVEIANNLTGEDKLFYVDTEKAIKEAENFIFDSNINMNKE